MIITETSADEILPGDVIADNEVPGYYGTVADVAYNGATDAAEILLECGAVLVRPMWASLDVVA